ncbi:MAG: ABC transporter ATP-binding protein/permease [Bacilli bacterium]|nr:ABC transporter ATP-binding protein/permease [Bacilli bacterium]
MEKKNKNIRSFLSAAIAYSDGLSKGSIVLLCVVSLLCAACNVLVPLLQKKLLEGLDHADNSSIWIMAAIAAAGCLFLMLENFINISIMLRFRRELEDAMFDSLAFKEQPLIREKGAGVFAGAAIGDSEQISRVLAAGWFSIGFNLVGTIISLVITATWELYFLFIVLGAYVLILLAIFFSNQVAVNYFRKEKEMTYTVSSYVREMADTHRSIFTFGSYRAYQELLGDKRDARSRFAGHSERAVALGSAVIRLIQMMAVVMLFFFAANDLRVLSEVERAAKYPMIIALVSYLEAIFAPVGTLNTTYSLAKKFKAFYEPFSEYVVRESLGEVPLDLSLNLHDMSLIQDGSLVLASVNLPVEKVYGVYGLEGEAKHYFLSFLRGEAYPSDGHIAIGGARIYEIEKYLRLGLITFSSAPGDLFERGLEFNVTLGKQLLSDEDYESAWLSYQNALQDFFAHLQEGSAFYRKNMANTRMVLGDFFAFDARHLSSKKLQKEIVSVFEEISDAKRFVEEIGHSVFTRKYAKASRYAALLSELRLESLQEREFGINGKKLTLGDRALVLLARFLLPETKSPFVLLDPLDHLPVEFHNVAVRLLHQSLRGRGGFIFSQDVDMVTELSDEILFFSHGHMVGKGTHEQLKKKHKEYRRIVSSSKIKELPEEPEPTKKRKPVKKTGSPS